MPKNRNTEPNLIFLVFRAAFSLSPSLNAFPLPATGVVALTSRQQRASLQPPVDQTSLPKTPLELPRLATYKVTLQITPTRQAIA
ncbi:hypothetical protein KY285_028075 [Solanum tuberosum]|nr:hypothetical protein KY285_028075 [Solanum tuberosum]